MELVYVTEHVSVAGSWFVGTRHGRPGESEGFEFHLDAPPGGASDGQGIPLYNVYVCSDLELAALDAVQKARAGSDLVKRATTEERRALMALPGMPLDLGHRGEPSALVAAPVKARTINRKRTLELAILNGMGRELGDTLVGLQALRILSGRLSTVFDRVQIDLFQTLSASKTASLYRHERRVRERLQLPVTLDRLMAYDAYIDLCDLFDEVRSNQLPMIDLYLERLSIPPDSVGASDKRMRMVIDPDAARELSPVMRGLREAGRRLLMFHPVASGRLRSMPAARAVRFVEELLETTPHLVVSATPMAVKHPRFVDLSRCSKSFDHFASLVSQMDLLISVDTVTYHLADAFSVPTVAVFSSIRPELRVAYHPFATGILLGGEGNRVLGRHSDQACTEDELCYAEGLWDELEVREVLARLDERARAAAKAGARALAGAE